MTVWERASRAAGEPYPPPDKSFALRTHCPHGHAYDEANTYVNPKTGHRGCRACGRRKAKHRRELAIHARIPRSRVGRLERTIELLNEYGRAKFGDEWWPGNAVRHIGKEKAMELHKLGVDQGYPDAGQWQDDDA